MNSYFESRFMLLRQIPNIVIYPLVSNSELTFRGTWLPGLVHLMHPFTYGNPISTNKCQGSTTSSETRLTSAVSSWWPCNRELRY